MSRAGSLGPTIAGSRRTARYPGPRMHTDRLTGIMTYDQSPSSFRSYKAGSYRSLAAASLRPGHIFGGAGVWIESKHPRDYRGRFV